LFFFLITFPISSFIQFFIYNVNYGSNQQSNLFFRMGVEEGLNWLVQHMELNQIKKPKRLAE